MLDFVKNYIKEFYKEDNKVDGKVAGLGIIFAIVGIIVIALVSSRLSILDKIILGYLGVFLVTMGIFMIVATMCSKFSFIRNHKVLGIALSVVPCIFIFISLIPISVLYFIKDKAKLSISSNNLLVYVFGLIIPLFASLIICSVIKDMHVPKSIGIISSEKAFSMFFIVFIVCINKLVLYIWKKLFKIDEIEYGNIKKDFYVLRFFIITLVTIVLNLFTLDEELERMFKYFNGSFAIYIACDRLATKWNKVNAKK